MVIPINQNNQIIYLAFNLTNICGFRVLELVSKDLSWMGTNKDVIVSCEDLLKEGVAQGCILEVSQAQSNLNQCFPIVKRRSIISHHHIRDATNPLWIQSPMCPKTHFTFSRPCDFNTFRFRLEDLVGDLFTIQFTHGVHLIIEFETIINFC